MQSHMSSPVRTEPLLSPQKLLCWKSIFAGLLVSVMSYMILTALGAGIGGLTASNIISHEKGGAGLATGAGLWLGLSTVISLFLGSYFALRVAKFVTNKVGAAHGIVIASIFFMLMVWGAGRIIGGVSRSMVVMGYDSGLSMQDEPVKPDGPAADQAAAKDIAERTANAVADAGWSMFVTFLVGLIAAIIGGRVGAKANYDRPFTLREKAI